MRTLPALQGNIVRAQAEPEIRISAVRCRIKKGTRGANPVTVRTRFHRQARRDKENVTRT